MSHPLAKHGGGLARGNDTGVKPGLRRVLRRPSGQSECSPPLSASDKHNFTLSATTLSALHTGDGLKESQWHLVIIHTDSTPRCVLRSTTDNSIPDVQV